jgi:hypothetical protein
MRRRTAAVIFAVSIATAGLARAADDPTSLRGLRGVYVLVESLQPEVERAGLTKAAIQTDAELKLRFAGIRVLTGTEFAKEPGRPYLYLNANVNAIPGKSPWGYSTSVELYQVAQLDRDSSFRLEVSTWREGGGGASASPSTIANRVRSDLKDLVDRFINAYLSVNQK